MKMGRIISFIDHISDWTMKVCRWFGVVLVFIVLYEVGMRYLFNSPTRWAFDITLILYSVFFLMGGSWVSKEDAHIKVDVLYELFPETVRKGLVVVYSFLLLFPLCIVMVWSGTKTAVHSFQIKEITNVSQWGQQIWYWRAIIPISFLLLFLQGVAELLKLAGFKSKGGKAHGA